MGRRIEGGPSEKDMGVEKSEDKNNKFTREMPSNVLSLTNKDERLLESGQKQIVLRRSGMLPEQRGEVTLVGAQGGKEYRAKIVNLAWEKGSAWQGGDQYCDVTLEIVEN